MSGIFLDSNVLIYAVLPTDARSATAQGLLAAGGTISVQVLNEFASVAKRKLQRSWPEIVQALADIRLLCPTPLPLTAATHGAALGLADRHGFSFYDALIVASALEGGCTTLLTEDMQDGLVVAGRLTLRNPFKPG